MGTAVAYVALFGATPAAHAALPDGCTQSVQTVTCAYTYTGSEQTFTVPATVTSVQVTAIGAAGAPSDTDTGGRAGRGGEVQGSVPVTAGQTLYIEVGGIPTQDSSNCLTVDACIGGFNGGGSSGYFGGGGGGASDVRTVSRADVGTTLASRLVIAAGGGGGGEAFPAADPSITLAGGAGGDAGQPGGGGDTVAGAVAVGGGAGTTTQGGAAGSTSATESGPFTRDGSAGALGQGGDGGQTGGAGGGGYYGGGGGATDTLGSTAGTGGGGGSSLIPDGGTFALTSSVASVTIIYTVPTALPVASTPQQPFTDVPLGAPFEQDIAWLKNQGITGGYADGSFHPTAPITREAMAAFLYREAHDGKDAPAPAAAPFMDVPTTAPFAGAVAWLKAQHVTTGYADGTFQPTRDISRSALAAFLYRVDHDGRYAATPTTAPFTDVPVTAPFAGDISWLKDQKITNGYQDGTFRPSSDITREAVAAFLHRAATN